MDSNLEEQRLRIGERRKVAERVSCCRVLSVHTASSDFLVYADMCVDQ